RERHGPDGAGGPRRADRGKGARRPAELRAARARPRGVAQRGLSSAPPGLQFAARSGQLGGGPRNMLKTRTALLFVGWCFVTSVSGCYQVTYSPSPGTEDRRTVFDGVPGMQPPPCEIVRVNTFRVDQIRAPATRDEAHDFGLDLDADPQHRPDNILGAVRAT